MRGFLLTVLLLIVVVLGVGFYLGWFRLSAQRDAANDKIHVTFDINRGKIEQDANKARAQVGQAGRQVAEGAKEAAEKVGAVLKGNHRAKGEVVKIDEAEARL